jgi:hypothetical protein
LCGIGLTFVFHRYTLLSRFDLVQADPGDTRFIASILEHWFKVFQGIDHWRSPPWFFPKEGTLGYSDVLLGMAVPYSAFRALGAGTFVAMNLMLVLLSFVSYLACLWLLPNVNTDDRCAFSVVFCGIGHSKWFLRYSPGTCRTSFQRQVDARTPWATASEILVTPPTAPENNFSRNNPVNTLPSHACNIARLCAFTEIERHVGRQATCASLTSRPAFPTHVCTRPKLTLGQRTAIRVLTRSIKSLRFQRPDCRNLLRAGATYGQRVGRAAQARAAPVCPSPHPLPAQRAERKEAVVLLQRHRKAL